MLVNAEGWKQVRQYKLDYRTANDSGVTGRSKLWQLTKCGTTSTECLRPTTFEWQLGQDAYQAGHNQFFPVPLNAGVMLITADFDGDGRTDLVYPDTDHWKYVFARQTPINGTRYYDGAFDGAHPGSSGEKATAFVVDFDLDGRPDLLKRDGFPNGHWMGFLTRGSSGQHEVMHTAFSGPLDQSSLPGNGAMFGDFDGDGLQDVLEYKPIPGLDGFYLWTWRKRTGKVNLKPQAGGNGVYEDQAFGPVQPVPVVGLSQLPGDSVLVFDVDGDGRDEVLTEAFGTGQLVAVDIPTGTKSAPLNLSASVLRLDMKLADVNGDGLVDVLVSSTEDLFRMVLYYENTGRGFRSPVGLLAGQYGFKAARVIDVNRDGLSDFLVPRASASDTTRFVGMDLLKTSIDAQGKPVFTKKALFDFASPMALNNLVNQGVRVVDVDGDGDDDLLYVQSLGGYVGHKVLFKHVNGGKPDLLQAIYDGRLITQDATVPSVGLTYAPLTDTNVYAPGECKFIEFMSCVRSGPMQVVKRVERDAGLNGLGDVHNAKVVSEYFYTGGRFDKITDGFAGFAETHTSSRFRKSFTSGDH